MSNLANLMGRASLSAIFILSGLAKLGSGYEATQGYMEAMGVSSSLLPLVIVTEILGGFALATGFLTRWAAIGLAVFTLASAFLFHFDLGDQNQLLHFMKNIAIAGGLLVVAVHGPGRVSADNWLAKRRADATLGAPHVLGGAR